MVPETPLASGVVRGALRLGEKEHDGVEKLGVASPSVTSGGTAQLRGADTAHDRKRESGVDSPSTNQYSSRGPGSPRLRWMRS